MNLTVADAREFVHDEVDGGVSPNDPRVLLRINEATERIMPRLNSPEMKQWIETCIFNQCVTLDRGIRRVIRARIDGEFAEVFNEFYRFMETGPGWDGASYFGLSSVPWRVPTQYAIPEASRLMVVCEDEEDAGAEMFFRGQSDKDRDVFTNGVPGEKIPIKYDEGWVTAGKYTSLQLVRKPRTKGFIHLSTIDEETGHRQHLSSYHPDETSPLYRRYLIEGTVPGQTYRMIALVKTQFFPVTHDNDLLQVQSLAAMKKMIACLRYEQAKDMDTAAYLEAKAMEIISDNADDDEGDAVVTDSRYGSHNGDLPNVQ